jgi:hypothetical protein
LLCACYHGLVLTMPHDRVVDGIAYTDPAAGRPILNHDSKASCINRTVRYPQPEW